MADLFYNPTTYIATVAVLGILWGVHRWLAKVGYTTSEFPKLVQEIRDELKGIRDQIQQIFKLLPRQPVVGASPLKLTDFGEKIADNIQAQAWADKVAPGLVREVADMRPFEIDQFSNTYVETRLPKELHERVASTAYEVGTTLEDV